ncbi:hypothetical protein M8J75_007163 [Diaphorina citri]|nr:hypothetical protein M8J75_007163 [Diaphorina citri]
MYRSLYHHEFKKINKGSSITIDTVYGSLRRVIQGPRFDSRHHHDRLSHIQPAHVPDSPILLRTLQHNRHSFLSTNGRRSV